VFLAVGLGATARLGIPGEDIEGVVESLDFIFQSHTGPLSECRVGQNVVVLGAGNTAIDVATQAARLGAKKVTIAYRRTDKEMSAFAYEYDLAKADGVEFRWLVQPVEFIEENGALTGVKMSRVRAVGEGRSARLEQVERSEFIIPCDMAIKALGQTPVLDFTRGIEGMRSEDGQLIMDPDTRESGIAGLFLGGDCTHKGAEIVDAVQDGKVAASGIDTFLRKDS
jgi:glutamate synthase (NADPH/NADH) small chain